MSALAAAAGQSPTSQFLVLFFATLLGAVCMAIASASVHLLRGRVDSAKEDAEDMGTLTDFFFDTPEDQRTRTPGKKGWTTRVDERLAAQEETLVEHGDLLLRIVKQVEQDGNGGHNLRGSVDRAATIAETIVNRPTQDDGTTT